MAYNWNKVGLLVCLLIFGTFNSLLLIWPTKTLSKGSNLYDNPRNFYHPFVQMTATFVGQFLCCFVYWLFYRFRPTSTDAAFVSVCKWFLFLLPALLHIIASTITIIGLNLTISSGCQMFRGAVVVFTGLLSVAFLGRSIRVHNWIGIATLTVGLFVVGLADAVFFGVTVDANGIVAGSLLIILAHIILSAQFVYEEKYLKKHNVPASLAIGLEGLFGGVIMGALLVPMFYIRASKPFSQNPGHLEDVFDALAQMKNNWRVTVAVVGEVITAAVSGYFGMKVTKEMSATTRQVVYSGRSLFVWVVSLCVHWQKFESRSFSLELAGFVLLIIGSLIYHDLIFRPLLVRFKILKRTRRAGAADDTSELMTSNAEGDDDDEQRLIRNDRR